MTKSRAWMYTLLAAACLVGYCAGVLIPGQASIAALRRDLHEKRQFVADVDRQMPQIEPLEAQLERARNRVDQWRAAAPQEPNLVHVLGKLANLARDCGIRLNRLNPQATTSMAVLRQHPLSLELEGTFSQLLSFLSGVEQMPETIWVRQIQLQSKSEAGETAQYDLMLTVFADNREISG
jgi:Tfp pilus assembly protein PilO